MPWGTNHLLLGFWAFAWGFGRQQMLTGILQLATSNLLLQLVATLGIERRHAGHHLKQQDPHAPPVHILAVPLPLDDLRGHVLHCADEAVCAFPISHVTLGQAKVSDLDVSLAVQQHILLQSTM